MKTDSSLLNASSQMLSDAAHVEIANYCDQVRLTPRETEVVQVMAEGVVRIRDIASRLSLSPNTVNNHVNSIFSKTRARSKSELLAILLSRIADELQELKLCRRKPRVLLFKSNAISDADTKATLETLGCDVHLADSGADFEQVNEDYSPHFVLLEIGSANFSSNPQLAIRIRELSQISEAHLVLLSRNADWRGRREVMDLGAIDLLGVPLDSEKFKLTIFTHFIEDDALLYQYLCQNQKPIGRAASPQVALRCSEVDWRSIGRGGIHLAGDEVKSLFSELPKEGDVVVLRLKVPGFREEMKLRGQVIWCLEGEGAGIRFLHSQLNSQLLKSRPRELPTPGYIPHLASR